MTDVVSSSEDVIVQVPQPVIPPSAPPVKVGLVEISPISQRGSMWMTGTGAPSSPGGQVGDMYLDMDTGDVYRWDGAAWQFQGTFAPSTLTAAEILALLITVDGTGSGLDADLLDGHDTPYFATQAALTTEKNRNDTQDTSIINNTTSINNNASAIVDLQTATTPASLLTSIKTVDGAGSGLDADTFDGHDTSYFGTAAADTTLQANINLKADIASPTFTGDPKAPTPAVSDNDTSIATTAFVKSVTSTIVPFPEAPLDGLTYGRKSGTWATVIGGAATNDTPPPGPLVDGQLWWKSDTGTFYVYYDDGNSQQWVEAAAPAVPAAAYAMKTARRSNLIVNGALNISQENGNTEGTVAGYYAADQFLAQWTASTAALGFGRIAAANPSGSQNRLRFRVTTAKASLAAGDLAVIEMKLEGLNVQDLGWSNAASQKDAVLAFGFNGPAGVYTVAVRNGAPATHSFVASFTVTAGQANTDTTQIIRVPAPTGMTTWAVDNTLAIVIDIVVAAGTTWFAPAAGWNSGNFLGITGMSNGLAAVQSFQIWDIGLYADPDKTGVPPVFEVPNYADELARCLRYWQFYDFQMAAYAAAGTQMQIAKPYPVYMRAIPSVGTFAAGTPTNVAAASLSPGPRHAIMLVTPTATGLASYFNNIQTLNARM
jgi:hypothetical protein